MGSVWSNDDTNIPSVNRRITQIVNQRNTGNVPENSEIGNQFNGWRKPVSKFGWNEGQLANLLRTNNFIGQYDIPNGKWQKSCAIVDEITKSFWHVLSKIAAKDYPNLHFEHFVHQGSSREGLKIREPNEFDMILPFEINGLQICTVPALDSNGEEIPSLIKLKVSGKESFIKNHCPRLSRLGVFEFRHSHCFLNAENLQLHVIASIMDRAIGEIQQEIDRVSESEPCSFRLRKSSVFPPTYRFQITITSDEGFDGLEFGRSAFNFTAHGEQASFREAAWSGTVQEIEFDIVPGLLVATDDVPNPNSYFSSMTCDRYAVMKWVHKQRFSTGYQDPDLLWRESSAGYEKHILDVSRKKAVFLHIMTACRIMKAYLDGIAMRSSQSIQLGSLLTSYHLKNIAIHCILLDVTVAGVKDALGYFIAFLDKSLEKEFLPHFFYGNQCLTKMFPSIKVNRKRLNLYRHVSGEHLLQARRSMIFVKSDLDELFTSKHFLRNQGCLQQFDDLCCENNVDERNCIIM